VRNRTAMGRLRVFLDSVVQGVARATSVSA
jgi:hypothetical protein